LAYLKNVRTKFGRNKLYPELSDLIFHFNNLKRLQENKDLLQKDFPKEIKNIDLNKLKLEYQQLMQDDDIMSELHSVIEYSIPKMKNTLEEGKEIYEFVEETLSIEPVGVVPVYKGEGYLFLQPGDQNTIQIYRYTASVFQKSTDTFKSLRLSFIGEEFRSITQNLRNIKLNLTRRFSELPNPATYFIYSPYEFPVQETLLPISKRYFMRHLEL
jgi:hypothetical protein